MNDARLIAIALAAIVLIGSARLCWQQWRGARRGAIAFAALLALQATAGGLLYLTLVPPARDAAAGQLVVLGAHADQVRWQQRPGDTVISLPEAGARPGAQRAPDLATALRQHPGTDALRLIGDGLAARDRDTRLPAQVSLEPPAAARGWIGLQPPAPSAPGAVFNVAAQSQGLTGGSAELLDPAGQVIARAALDRTGGVRLDGVARAAGRSTFSLRLLDAGQHVIDSVVVPQQTLEAPATRVLIVAGAPGPELKYLRRWATDTGLRVQSQASAGAGVSLGDPPAALTAARLAQTDLLILDERSLAALGSAQRATVQQALRGGLGVLVRSTGPLGDGARQTLRSWDLVVTGNAQSTPLALPADPDAALLQARRGPTRASTDSTVYIEDAQRASQHATVPALEQLALRSSEATALLHDAKDAAVGGWRDAGRGRIALLPVTDSYRLVLAGRDDRHAELWSSVVATLARPLPDHGAARLGTDTAWAGERVSLCQLPAGAQVQAADGRLTTLIVDPRSGTARCAGYWPDQSGWHQLRQGDSTQAFYVFDPAQAVAMHRQQTHDATVQRIASAGPATASAVTQVPGPRGPWLLAFVLVAGVLWWLERRRAPVAAAAAS